METKKIKGYSLVETIVYLAIFTVMSIVVINSFIIILSSFNTTNMNRRLLESGMTSMERLSREIRQASSVNASSTSTMLILNDSGTATTEFVNENGSLNLYKNGNLEGNLLGSKLTITSLNFNHITTTKSEAVRVRMTLQYLNGKTTKSANFYDTIILRGSY